MKASLKLREEQRPLARAKVPISILGLPFLSGVTAGDARELRLDLATAFDAGPSLRLSYRPNDPSNPFSIVLKTGIGNFGSPTAAAMSMSAEFNLLARPGATSPAFSILFKPRIGDFHIRKSTRSPTKIAADPDVDGSEKSVNGFGSVNTINGIHGLLSGVEVTARSVLPLKSRAAVNFRWGLKVPAELRTAFDGDGISLRNLPMMVMSKVSVEQVSAVEAAATGNKVGAAASVDVAEACMAMNKQMEAMRVENGLLRKAVEDLRADVGGGAATNKLFGGGDVSKGAVKSMGKRDDGGHLRPQGIGGKAATPEEVDQELKKALMGAIGGAGQSK